ncbi:MLO-like protein 1 [Zea mays]|uniref:MLO-like protein 1 n=1 Tax=Zea mays TaxID=4577 RepID=A0A1D6Q3D4_MAIZE|nr:MLO-like protein 1 [Zea mays]
MAGGDGADEITLEHTPTWIVASVCSIIVVISLLFERLLHRLGKRLAKGRRKPLYEALLKVKEELMLLGFISLLLTVFQGATQKICVRESLMNHLLPCPRTTAKTSAHFVGTRRLLAGGGGVSSDYCLSKGKVPILSVDAIHQLHIFIFVLAVTHVVLSAVTVILGITQTRNWKYWEEKIQQNDDSAPQMIKHVQEFKFIKSHFRGHGKRWGIFGWLRSFFKQFYGSVTEEDYTTLRLGFVMKHCRGHPKFNFYNYMDRAFEGDFKKVVGISWYLWGMLMIFLLLNVHGWYVYIWISVIPFILLLVLGSKMEHIITELALEVIQKHTAIEGVLVVTPSDELFWFHRPKLVLLLIHIILFQNAFEIAFFFWLLFDANILSFSLIKMGSSFKKAIFDENVSEGLINWAENARRRNRMPTSVGDNSPVGEGIQMSNQTQRESSMEQGTARQAAAGSAASDPDPAAPVFPVWARTPSECLAELGVSADRGLSSEEAAARLQRHYSEFDAAGVVRQIARGLQALHGAGVVHRDLKPENCLFADRGEASTLRIMDFGLSSVCLVWLALALSSTAAYFFPCVVVLLLFPLPSLPLYPTTRALPAKPWIRTMRSAKTSQCSSSATRVADDRVRCLRVDVISGVLSRDNIAMDALAVSQQHPLRFQEAAPPFLHPLRSAEEERKSGHGREELSLCGTKEMDDDGVDEG